MNEIIWILTLVISFGLVLVSYKFIGKTGLYLWIAIATIISNIQTVKLIDLFGFETSLGTILYGSTFLSTDILNLKYGSDSAKKSIIVGFITMISMTFFMYVCLLYEPSVNDFSQESLYTIFSVNIRITMASLISFVISQFFDAILFDKLQKKYKKLWLSNNISTLVCQIIDTVTFCFITYYGILNMNAIFEIIFSMYILKFIISLCDTPFIYLSKNMKNINEL